MPTTSSKHRSGPEERVLSSLQDVVEMSSSHGDSQWIYRGEDSTNYKLIPKVGRLKESKSDDFFETEKSALRAFARRAAPHLPNRKLSEIEMMSIGQHHGLATRLLDWTENPFVAVFFACGNTIVPGDRRLYALDTSNFYFMEEDESPFKIDRVMLLEPNHISPRITAQRGVFSVHPSPAVSFRHKNLRTYRIPDSVVIEMFINLGALGVSPETLFPGLGGTAEQVNHEYF
jgi:hypothetical protein